MEFPDIEAVQKHSKFIEELEQIRYDITEGTVTYEHSPDFTKPLEDAVKIEIYIEGQPAIEGIDEVYDLVGAVWIFDIGALIYESNYGGGSSQVVLQNGGVIITKTDQTAYIYNNPLHWSSELLDGSKILFFRMINLAEDLVHEAPHIDGTATVDVNFYVSSDRTFVDSTCGNLAVPINDLKIKMYGNPDIIDAWRLFYKIDLGFKEGDDIFSESFLYLNRFYPEKYVLALNYANCNIGMEVEVTE